MTNTTATLARHRARHRAISISISIWMLVGLLPVLSGCRSADSSNQQPATRNQKPATSITLLDQKLLETIEMEEQLDAAAAVPDADPREIERMFHNVAREYEGIIARNPQHLETLLLYGKLLSRYGDREGARIHFLTAAQIDPNLAVIHQQLSKYYAEDEDYTRALAYALNAVRIEPETAAYHFGLGQILAVFREDFISEGVFTADQIDRDMLQSFDTARSLEPESLELQFRYAEAFYDVDIPDWETALALWQEIASREDLSPVQVDAVRVHQARCLSEIGRPEEARVLLEQVQSPSLKNSSSD